MRTIAGPRDREAHLRRVRALHRALQTHPAWKRARTKVRDFCVIVLGDQCHHGIAFVSRESLARRLECSESAARQVIRDAVRLGLVLKAHQGHGRHRANGFVVASCALTRPADNRPAAGPVALDKPAGQRLRKWVENHPPVVRKDSYVSSTSVGYSHGERPAPEKRFEMVPKQPPDGSKRVRPDCPACWDEGRRWDEDRGVVECECQTAVGSSQTQGRVLIDTKARGGVRAAQRATGGPLSETWPGRESDGSSPAAPAGAGPADPPGATPGGPVHPPAPGDPPVTVDLTDPDRPVSTKPLLDIVERLRRRAGGT